MTAPLFTRLRPMLLEQRREPFDGDEWLFEPKWDGWRCIAVVRDGRARLISRRGNNLTACFPAVAEALGQLPDETVVDGKIVVLSEDGYPDFGALMRRRGPPSLLAFDLPALGGRDLCAERIEDRKRRLAGVVADLAGPIVQNTDALIGGPIAEKGREQDRRAQSRALAPFSGMGGSEKAARRLGAENGYSAALGAAADLALSGRAHRSRAAARPRLSSLQPAIFRSIDPNVRVSSAWRARSKSRSGSRFCRISS